MIIHADKPCDDTRSKVIPSQRPHPQSEGGVATSEVVKSTSGGNIGSLSENHIDSIMIRLKGGQHTFKCPICMRQLHSHETEFSARLHIEQCLLSQEKQ